MIEHFEYEVKNYSDRHQGKRVRISIKKESYTAAYIYNNHIFTKILVVDLTLET